MNSATIAFIGGGNMAASLIGGLIADGYPADRIRVADPDLARCQGLNERFGVHTGADNQAAAQGAAAVVLAVKPQLVQEVAKALGPGLRDSKVLWLSIAAGVQVTDLARWLSGEAAVVRAMPNTPALVQTGATALYANRYVRDDQRDLAESLMRAVGITRWLDDERLMDAVTAVSGSGPAYFFLLIEHLQAAGVRLGLTPETARLLTLETALGAARMALESEADAATLRQRVTSPGGTTERAVQAFEDGGFGALVDAAVQAAAERAAELGKLLGEQ